MPVYGGGTPSGELNGEVDDDQLLAALLQAEEFAGFPPSPRLIGGMSPLTPAGGNCTNLDEDIAMTLRLQEELWRREVLGMGGDSPAFGMLRSPTSRDNRAGTGGGTFEGSDGWSAAGDVEDILQALRLHADEQAVPPPPSPVLRRSAAARHAASPRPGHHSREMPASSVMLPVSHRHEGDLSRVIEGFEGEASPSTQASPTSAKAGGRSGRRGRSGTEPAAAAGSELDDLLQSLKQQADQDSAAVGSPPSQSAVPRSTYSGHAADEPDAWRKWAQADGAEGGGHGGAPSPHRSRPRDHPAAKWDGELEDLLSALEVQVVP